MNNGSESFYEKAFSCLVEREEYRSLEQYRSFWDDWIVSQHKNLTEMLLKADPEAWEFIKLYSIRFYVFRKKSALADLVKSLNWSVLEEDELYVRLYYKMIAEEKLKLYKHKGPIQFWMRQYVKGIIYKEFYKKNEEKTESLSHQNYEPGYYDERDSDVESERRDYAQRCFAELWKDNPMQAYVLLLRDKVGISSKKVAALLNHTNDVNINQIHSRALNNLKKIAKNMDMKE